MNYVVWIVCVVFAILSISMVLSNSQAYRRFAVMELMLVMLTVACAGIGFNKAKEMVSDNYMSLYAVYYGGMESSIAELEKMDKADIDWIAIRGDVDAALLSILPTVNIGDDQYKYNKAVILQREQEGRYYEVAYMSDYDVTEFSEDDYALANTLINRAISEKSVGYGIVSDETGMLAVVDTSKITANYCLVTEVPLNPLMDTVAELRQAYVIWSLIFLAGCTLILALVVFAQGIEMRKMLKTAVRVAEGKADWDSLSVKESGALVESNEVRMLKNTLRQISSEVAKMNYVKYRYLQAYYRFAPRKIETILDKQSILDVEPLDRIHTIGTVAFVSFGTSPKADESEALKEMNDNFGLLCEVGESYDGITATCNSDLSVVQELFLGETKKALAFGNEIIGRKLEDPKGSRPFVLLHRTPFVYGVAGNDDQAFTYVLSQEMRILEKHMDQLKGMGIPMAATDSTYEMLDKNTETRYIGYVEEGNYIFKLYEVLDAYPAKERMARIESKSKFKKALNLFYQGDFYLARNLFTEVLKDCPSDEVAKWYLFLSEERLNESKSGNSSLALFS